MGIKVFISYSHKDEVFKDTLIEALTPLKRNGLIDTWHDRDINAGDEWKNEISKNLSEANIILFLVSASFLASDYCHEKEANEAIKLHGQKKVYLVPIIIRPCAWEDSPLANFQGLPKDAKPVTQWSPEDLAWKDIIIGLKKILSDFTPPKQLAIKEVEENSPALKESQLAWANDTEVILTHRKVDRINLSDIYIDPDLEVLDDSKSKDVEIISSKDFSKKEGFFLFFGEEQQGKTSLLKTIYIDLLKNGILPIYLQAKDIKKSNIEEILANEIKSQYDNLDITTFLAQSNKALLIDDISEISLNSKYRGHLLEQINKTFNKVFITGNISYSYVAPEIPEFTDYTPYSLRNLGNEKRAELVEKWVSLGNKECIPDDELFRTCDEVKSRLDLIVRKNIVPAKPIYLIMLLQMFEAYSQQNLELTSYGHCYQELIYQSLRNAGIHQRDVSKYLNVLVELSWAIHLNGDGLNRDKLDQFFTEYDKKYLAIDRDVVISKLRENSILREVDFKLHFKYPYIFYFFTAKKIADYYQNDDNIKIELRNLLESLHREDYANILVFVTHHTKDSGILNEIQKTLKTLFDDQEKAKLTKDQLQFMDSFISKIPKLVMEQREIRNERDKHNKRLDAIEKEELKTDNKNDDNDQYESADILAKINKTFKGMEIAGQIIRNRHATMTRDSLFMLADEGTSTGLRFLNYFINISDIAKAEVIKYIEHKLSEHPNLSDKEIEDYAEGVFIHLTYGVINGVIRKIASSVGSKEAQEIYAQLESYDPSPANVLLKQAIQLQFNRIIDIDQIAITEKKLEGNPVCKRILREMVIQHTYMFPVGYKQKQQLCELLDISVQGQRVMDIKKIGKG